MAETVANRSRRTATAGAIVVGLVLMIDFAVGAWIVVRAVDVLTDPEDVTRPLDLFPPLRGLSTDEDTVLVVLVIGAGMLGSFIHSATSFVSYLGNRQFEASWTLWFSFRPLIGVALALFVYLVFRGGLIAGGAGAESINVFGVAALAGLAGLFSKQAVDKLREVFDTFFRTAEAPERKDSLHAGVLSVEIVEPEVLHVGSPGQRVFLVVSDDATLMSFEIDGVAVSPVRVHGHHVEIEVDPVHLAEPTTLRISVAPPAGATAAATTIDVVEAPEPGATE